MKPGWNWRCGLIGLVGLVGPVGAAPVLAADPFQHPRTVAQAQAVLDRAMPDAAAVEVVRGRFRQQKFLRDVPKPLGSTGEFLLVRDRGLWWHTQQPHEAQRVLAARDPVAGLLLALFVLDLAPLARSFDLFLTQSGPQWRLGLRPHDAAVAAYFEQVVVGGGQGVEHVTLLEATGDRTEITLEAAPDVRSSLTAIERERLGL